MEKIVFFYPTKNITEELYYMCKLADATADSGKYLVFFADYYNGFSDDLLENTSVRKVPFENVSDLLKIFPDETINVITTISNIHTLPALNSQSKIVFLDSQVNQCNRLYVGSSGKKTSIAQIICEKEAICFSDVLQWKEIASEIGFEAHYVPKVFRKTDIIANHNIITTETINVGILSTFTINEAYGAINVIDCISKDYPNEKVNIHLFVKTDFLVLLKDRYYGENINIIDYSDLTEERILAILSEKTDLVFACGSNALVASSVSLPTVIMPIGTNLFRSDQFVFLCDTSGYALEWNEEQLSSLEMPTLTVKEVVDSVYCGNNKSRIGSKCLHYAIKYHSNPFPFIESAIRMSSLHFEEISSLIERRTTKQKHFKTAYQRIKVSLGVIKQQYSLFGIPLVIFSEVDSKNYNLFICLLPTLRIVKGNQYDIIHFLPVLWLYKALKKVFFKAKKMVLEHAASNALVETAISTNDNLNRRIQNKLADGKKIRICLFEMRIACWQFGRLYSLLEESGIFEPIVVVIPFMFQGKRAMFEEMEQTYNALCEKGYRVIKGYDRDTKKYLNIKEVLDPDAVFYSMFWKPHFQEYSYITQFEDIYSFLYAYGLDIISHPNRESMNYELQNKVTRYYQTTTIHKGLCEDNMDNHGSNVYVTGSPKLDDIFDETYIPNDPWKKCGEKKRIIWAPHHMIFHNTKDVYELGAFLELAEPMKELVERYKDSIQFAFKPHPMLKEKLYKQWGVEETNDYYLWWEKGENTQLETGEFVDLFLTSDALILDSISFNGEYACTGKPSFFTYGHNTRFKANRFGKALMKTSYHNELPDSLVDEIIEFLENVVIKGEDRKEKARVEFVNMYLRPREGKTASDNIYEDLYRVIIDNKQLEYRINWANPEEVELI